jgi:ABC-2 type transport system ATP-binding protein
MLGLWDARSKLARDLSGGMQRRLALACALIHEPDVVFVDEPTAGIDPVLRETIWDEFRRLRNLGRTLFVTTQYVGESEFCDRVALLDQGKLIACDAPEALRDAAFGGEMIEIEAQRPFDGQRIAHVPEVLRVHQPGARELVVTVRDAGSAIPRLIEAVENTNNTVVSSREYRPSFDEVFTELLSQHKVRNEESAPRSAVRSA